MAKKIVDENGNTDVQKKPFYKRGWFWTLAIIVVLVIAAIGRADDSAKKVSSEHKTTSSAKVNRQTFKVGDTVKADGVTLKLNKVDYYNGSSISTPDSGKMFVMVNVTITNVDRNKVSYNPLDFKLDDNGNRTDLTEIVLDDNGHKVVGDDLKSGDLTKGASITGTLVGQAVQTDKLKLIYTGSLFSKDEEITFDLD